MRPHFVFTAKNETVRVLSSSIYLLNAIHSFNQQKIPFHAFPLGLSIE